MTVAPDASLYVRSENCMFSLAGPQVRSSPLRVNVSSMTSGWWPNYLRCAKFMAILHEFSIAGVCNTNLYSIDVVDVERQPLIVGRGCMTTPGEFGNGQCVIPTKLQQCT